ncbi:MAG: glycosyltransferase family 2 protein [Elusimicrobia bacterium]|nr:glycosyltransferase family 2 protein [Elusimicrobiota bacterium]
MPTTLTAIVPALNEQGNIESTIEGIVPLLEKSFKDYEVLIFNDCSSDETGTLAERLASKNKNIKVIHNPITMGLGYNYKRGVEIATKDYIIMIPGDNEITIESFENMFKKLGEKEIIVPYTVNMEIRPFSRRILSKTYTWLINLLFGTHLKYFNGPVIHKRELIQTIPIHTNGFAYQTELLLKMIKSGHNYLELGMVLKDRNSGKSKALLLKNIIRVSKSIFQLFYKINIKKDFK